MMPGAGSYRSFLRPVQHSTHDNINTMSCSPLYLTDEKSKLSVNDISITLKGDRRTDEATQRNTAA